MTDFTIIEAKPHHCGQMARMLRHEHAQAVAMLGMDSHRELRARFDASSFRRAWLADDRLAALGGVTGPILSSMGYVWLAFSESATRYPLAIIKEARRQLAQIATVKRSLATSILDGDETSKRFAVFLGFVPLDQESNHPAISRYGRRELVSRCERNAEARIAVGKGFAVAMGYQGEAA